MRWLDRSLDAACLLALVVVAGATLRPGGAVGRYLGERRAAREISALRHQVLSEARWRSGRLDTLDGPAVLVAFSDYECPFCRQFEHSVDSMLESGMALAVGIRHYPLPNHRFAEQAALIAICGELAGRFPEVHRSLFDLDWTGDSLPLTALASLAGYSSARALQNCTAGSAAKARLERDRELARRLGVAVTPTIVHADGVHAGFVNPVVLLARGDQE